MLQGAGGCLQCDGSSSVFSTWRKRREGLKAAWHPRLWLLRELRIPRSSRRSCSIVMVRDHYCSCARKSTAGTRQLAPAVAGLNGFANTEPSERTACLLRVLSLGRSVWRMCNHNSAAGGGLQSSLRHQVFVLLCPCGKAIGRPRSCLPTTVPCLLCAHCLPACPRAPCLPAPHPSLLYIPSTSPPPPPAPPCRRRHPGERGPAQTRLQCGVRAL